jgi:citrate lyase subunit beta/citryl-CoA lyase
MGFLRATPLPRSFLYVPGDRDDLIAKARRGPADALLLDLEDAVSAGDKTKARGLAADALRSRAPGRPEREEGGNAELWVRVDSSNLDDDLTAVVRAGLDGIVLAKCTPESLDRAGRLLDALESERGLPACRIGVVGLLETASAVTSIATMARHSRLITFGIGEVDLLADLRLRRSDRTAGVVDAIRARIVLECAAFGCAAPVAPTSTDFRDLDAFRDTSRTMLDLGFRSRTAIHPTQVPVIHEVFTPTSEEVEAAHAVADRLAGAAGGVATDEGGRLIDAAVIRAAHETLQRAQSR